MTDAHQEAQDAIWAARKSAAGFQAIGFKQGVTAAVKALEDQAKALKATSRKTKKSDPLQTLVLDGTAALALQIAGALRKLKPEKAS